MKTIATILNAFVLLAAMGCASTTAMRTTTAMVAPASHRPYLVLRTTRPMAFPGVPIYLIAELVGGDEVEATYCPRVVWMWADGTESSEDGDCAPYEQRASYQRMWMRGVVLSRPGQYVVAVRLEKPVGHIVVRTTLELTGLGGE